MKDGRDPAAETEGGALLPEILHNVEREAIRRALAICKGDVKAAAALLGVGRSTVYRRMKLLGIADPSRLRESNL